MKTRGIEAIVLCGLTMFVFSCVSSNTKKEVAKDEIDEVVISDLQENKLVDAKDLSANKAIAAEYALQSSPPVTVNYDRAQDEEYNSIVENRFQFAKDKPLSTFSIDVDAASYSNMRRFVNQGQLPPADAIRTEELINYFSYNYEKPDGTDPVKISAEVGECPWAADHRLVRIGIKAKEIAGEKLPASNLVFLIDVSGSMEGPTRLELGNHH